MKSQFNVAYGEGRKAKKWKNSTITLEELRQRLSTPFRTGETSAEYAKMGSAQRQTAKDKGGFVAGHLRGGLRRASAVESRSMLTLDLDKASLTFLDEYTMLAPYETLIYTTHSHTQAQPRYRLVVPLTRDVSPDEYQALSRLFAAEWSIAQFDPCSFIPSQLMFWPTAPQDGEYVFQEVEGTLLDPDTFLAAHPGWEDPTLLPTVPSEVPLHQGNAKVEDPLEKKGIVGAFCRAYGIEAAIERFLGDIYEPAGPGRYHFVGSTSGPGLLIFDNKWAYSNHATDPAYHQECNAFDLVRIHRFPNEDEKKSFASMSALLSMSASTAALENFSTAKKTGVCPAEFFFSMFAPFATSALSIS